MVQLFVKLVSCVMEDPLKSDEKISEESVLSIIRLLTKYTMKFVIVGYSSYESGTAGVILLGMPPITSIINSEDELGVVLRANTTFKRSDVNAGELSSSLVSKRGVLVPRVSYFNS